MSRQFDCVGCGRHIIRFIDLADEVCGMCLTLGSVRSRKFQDWQDGLISEAEMRMAFKGPPPAYICSHCGMASWNLNDGKHGYCGACGEYKVEVA